MIDLLDLRKAMKQLDFICKFYFQFAIYDASTNCWVIFSFFFLIFCLRTYFTFLKYF